MINKRLDWISRQLGLLEITKQIPVGTDVDSIQIRNRAMDVLSSTLIFLEVNISHEMGKLRILGISFKEIR